MAITINQEPDFLFVRPGWNKIQYLLNSSQSTQSGFKIVCKVYLETDVVQVLNLEKIPESTKIYVAAQDIIQTYINDTYSILNGDSVGFQEQGLSRFKLSFQEYYNGALQGSVVDSDDIYVNRSAYSRSEWIKGEFAQWQIATDATDNSFGKFLNGFNNEMTTTAFEPVINGSMNFLKMHFGQRQQLRFILDAKSPSLSNLEIELVYYNENFVKTNSNFINGLSFDVGKMYSFDIGSGQIGNHAWFNQDNMTPRSGIDKYMAIYFRNNTLSKTASIVKLFEWVPEVCSGYTPYEVHFLNKYGGFDSYTFTAKSRIDTNVNQATFKNQATDISGIAIVDKTSKRFIQPFHTQLSEMYTLNSQTLREWEYNGLKELLTSPEIYVVIDGDFYSVVVEGNKTIRNYRTEEGETFNLKVRFKLDNSELRQW